MTPRQRVLAAARLEETDRTPWVPFVGCHGGALIDTPADAYLRSAEAIVAGQAKAIELYRPDGLPVVFDLQIEAEALGCTLNWARDNPPAVTGHPLSAGVELGSLSVPGPEAGRIGTALDAARRLRAAHEEIALYGLITGPFTLALHLLGTEIFMQMYDEPARVEELMGFGRDVATAMAGYYIQAGCDVIAVVDPMTSQIGPEAFARFVTPYARPVFQAIRDAGAVGSFFVCGHAQQNIEAMCDCQPENVSVDENIPLDFVRDICLARGISFGGNLQLTTVLLLGSDDDARRNAVECMEIGGDKGFLLAPGCDLPYATPPANLQAVAEVVGDQYARQAVQAMARDEAAADLLDMSDYGQSDKVIVDVITLDSEACAPCQYMCEAVRSIAPEFEGIVQWREHKIKYRESLVFMTSLMVRNIPTICIDGKITFVSRIPGRDELVRAIQDRIFEKLRMKIHRRQGAILVLGDGGEACRALQANARRAITEMGLDVDVEMVTDARTIRSYGVAPAQTPAAVMATYRVRSTGTVPEPAILKEWLKDLT